MNGHGIDVCACGAIVRQCKCPGPHDPRVVRQSCPTCMQAPLRKEAPIEHNRTIDEEAVEIIMCMGMLVDRIDRAAKRLGCTRAELFKRRPSPLRECLSPDGEEGELLCACCTAAKGSE